MQVIKHKLQYHEPELTGAKVKALNPNFSCANVWKIPPMILIDNIEVWCSTVHYEKTNDTHPRQTTVIK
jgi:hypothetical protein